MAVSPVPRTAAKRVDSAESHLRQAVDLLNQVLADLRADGQGGGPVPRALQLATTNAETAVLWIACARHGGTV